MEKFRFARISQRSSALWRGEKRNGTLWRTEEIRERDQCKSTRAKLDLVAK